MDPSCRFMYRLRPSRSAMLTQGPTPDESRVIGEHFEYLTRAAAAGQVLLFGRTQTADESTFGIALLRFADAERAGEFMRADPAVRAGVMVAELFPFAVAGGCFSVAVA